MVGQKKLRRLAAFPAILTVVFIIFSNKESRLFGSRSPSPTCPSVVEKIVYVSPSAKSETIEPHEAEESVKAGDWGSLRCGENDFELYMYSAFYDDRELLSREGPAVVRVIGTSEYQDSKNVSLMCMLKYPGDPYPEITIARGTNITFSAQSHGKTFQEFIYVCPIRRKFAIPERVSMICSSSVEPQFYLKVETAEKPITKRDFAICVCASYSSRNVYQLVEWMELQQIFGVSKVTVYNHSIDDQTARILLHYVDEGLVDLRQTHSFWTESGNPYDRVKQHKAPTINDCLYRNMYSFKKIIVIDFDELIVPRMHANLSEMLAAVDRDRPPRHPARNYVFLNDYFPFDLPPDENISPKLLTMRYRKRLPLNPYPLFSKTIVNPVACTNMHHHLCWTKPKQYDLPGYQVVVQSKFGMSQHYKKICGSRQTECENQIKMHYQDDTMLRFKDQLVPRVAKQLGRLDLGPL